MIQRAFSLCDESLLGRVHRSDCLPFLCGLGTYSVDLIWADPPYNQGKDYGDHDDAMPWEAYWQWAAEWVAQSERVARRGVALYLPHRLIRGYWNLLPSASLVVIRKRARGTVQDGWVRQYHAVLTTAEGAERPLPDVVDTIRLPGEGYFFREKRHPHQAFTSEKLTEWALQALTLPGEVVLDPLAGTGTTIVVAERLGRRAFGCELHHAFADYAEARIEEARQRLVACFGEDGAR